MEETMNTSILSYPGFQSLPKATRQMLLFSETHFFNEQASHPAAQKGASQELGIHRGIKYFFTQLTVPAALPWDAPA
jgi:hypothetical protein